MIVHRGVCRDQGFCRCSATWCTIGGKSPDTDDASVCQDFTEPVTITCNTVAGRRPEGLEPRKRRERDALAAWFAESAWLEAASVIAFERLAAELGRLEAPAELARACEQAAVEERDHAARMHALVVRYGGYPSEPTVSPARGRPLFELARENIVEGCVKETFAAAVAVIQAGRASDPAVRATMHGIAVDEASHADLAHRIDEWARERLTAKECARLDDARLAAIRELRATLAEASDPGLAREAGLPTRTEAIHLVELLGSELWSLAA